MKDGQQQPSVEKYQQYLKLTGEWLPNSIKNGNDGSSAYSSPIPFDEIVEPPMRVLIL